MKAIGSTLSICAATLLLMGGTLLPISHAADDWYDPSADQFDRNDYKSGPGYGGQRTDTTRTDTYRTDTTDRFDRDDSQRINTTQRQQQQQRQQQRDTDFEYRTDVRADSTGRKLDDAGSTSVFDYFEKWVHDTEDPGNRADADFWYGNQGANELYDYDYWGYDYRTTADHTGWFRTADSLPRGPR